MDQNQTGAQVAQNSTPAAPFMDKAKRVAAVAVTGAALVAGNAHALTIDVTDVTQTITDGITTVTTLGISVLSLVVVVKLFKWVRGAL